MLSLCCLGAKAGTLKHSTLIGWSESMTDYLVKSQFMFSLTLYYKSESGQIRLANRSIQFSRQIFIFPLFLQVVQGLPAMLAYFLPLFPPRCQFVLTLPAMSAYLSPPQCLLASLDIWKQMTDRISDWTIGFGEETSVQSELWLDCLTRDWSNWPIKKLGSVQFYTVIRSYKVTDWLHQ